MRNKGIKEIKFRAWDGKRMFGGQEMMNKTIGQLQTWSNRVMQFTGFRDMAEKDIYEADIVRCHNGDFEVRWSENGYWAGFKRGQVGTPGLIHYQLPGEVIGNIYENPELLQ